MYIRSEGELVFRDPNHPGNIWKMTMKAAPLVPAYGTSSLPPAIGNIPIITVPAHVVGIRDHDPINRQYPGTVVINGLLVIEPRFMVERGGVEGVAIWTYYGGSSLSVSVTSEGGRNPLAPLNWVAGGNPLMDPTARLGLEWRTMPDGQVWYNHQLHGEPLGRPSEDWRDGSPIDLATMYTPNGRIRQGVWVLDFVQGLGTAEQTIDPANLRGTYTVAVWFADKKYSGYRLRSEPYTGGGYRSPDVYGSHLEGFGAGGNERMMSAPQVSHKMAHGGEIRQCFQENLYGPGYWPNSPSVVFRLWPVTPKTAADLQAINLDQRTGVPGQRLQTM